MWSKRSTSLVPSNDINSSKTDCGSPVPDALSRDADELGRLGVPTFMFQEGDSREVERVFREIARLTRGAYCRFDPGAARQLAELLRAVAVYAAGGLPALAARRDAGAIKLLGQLR
jgi:hypothetical protein